MSWALCGRRATEALRGNSPLPANADLQAGAPAHCLDLGQCLKPAFSLRLRGPLPSSAGTSGHSPVDVFCVARPERLPSGDPRMIPTSTPTSSSLRIRLHYSFSLQMRCYILRGAAKAVTPARRRKRASAPSPSCREPRQGPPLGGLLGPAVLDWRQRSTMVRSQADSNPSSSISLHGLDPSESLRPPP